MNYTLNCKGRLLTITEPIVMGILNVTPDSFYDGGRYTQQDNILRQCEKMLLDGAAIIDVGGMSSRPGAEVIDTQEELKRVVPVVEIIAKTFPEALISIDTVKSKVAQAAINAGGHIINDISAGQFDDALYETVANLKVPYILMHMQGTPKTMQHHPNYTDVVQHVLDFFISQIEVLRSLTVRDIVLDVGFGFGKSVEHNYQLLQRMNTFEIFDVPILAGISRKSMICKALKINPKQALNGTTALHIVALQQGASILRVHDVKEAKEVITLWKQLERVVSEEKTY